MNLAQQLARLKNEAADYEKLAKRFSIMAKDARELYEYMTHPAYDENDPVPITWDQGVQKIDMEEMDKRMAKRVAGLNTTDSGTGYPFVVHHTDGSITISVDGTPLEPIKDGE